MIVFIDESGDAGFRTNRGSSAIFVAGMVIFRDRGAAASCQADIADLAKELGIAPEFKFSKANDATRDAFFRRVRTSSFGVRAIVVEKERLYSPLLRTNKEQFYRFFLKTMMKFDSGVLQDAKVIIDGSGDRPFRRDLALHLKRGTAPGAVKSVKFKKSHSDELVQLADMCTGAIARSYRHGKKNARRWRDLLAPRIEDIWEFR